MDIRDEIIQYVSTMNQRSDIPIGTLVSWIGMSTSKYYSWIERSGIPNQPTGALVKDHWLLLWEKEAIIQYYRSHRQEGYRRLTYMMLDENIVAVSPSTTYRVLKEAGLLNRWNNCPKQPKKQGFDQPMHPHEQWHIDIKYVNFHGTFLFLISIIDGYSRYIVHHDLRLSMQEFDVQLTLERAFEIFPNAHPRMISDNGSQFIAKDFTEFLRLKGLQHTRTSVGHPQSNGKIERYHRTITEECLRTQSMITLEDARRQIAIYVHYYNTRRLHSALGYLTPEDVLLGRTEARLREREQKLIAAQQYRINVQNVLQSGRQNNLSREGDGEHFQYNVSSSPCSLGLA